MYRYHSHTDSSIILITKILTVQRKIDKSVEREFATLCMTWVQSPTSYMVLRTPRGVITKRSNRDHCQM